MIDNSTSLRDFLFRGLMLESEAERFQSAGIQIGASASNSDQHLLAEALAPFSVSRRNNALEMARLYALLHCFENEAVSYTHLLFCLFGNLSAENGVERK